jgi:hypothetical protein
MATLTDRSLASEVLLLRLPVDAASESSLDTDSTQTARPFDSDRWTYRSNSSTIFAQGLGFFSGRFLNAFGKAEIRGMKAVWMALRRRQISASFPHAESARVRKIDEMYDDLVDFLRYPFHKALLTCLT